MIIIIAYGLSCRHEHGPRARLARSVPKYLIVGRPYDIELVTPLTVGNVYITLGVPATHEREGSHITLT